jgi:pyruvate-formate lyase
MQAIVNLALPVITDKVEAVLDDLSKRSFQTSFATNGLREELVSYVLKRMPTVYTVADTSRAYSNEAPIHCFSKEQRNRIDTLINEGLDYLLYRYRTWEAAAQTATNGLDSSPSHWFG